MKSTNAIRRFAALMLAVVFTITAVFTAASVPAYAASKPAKVTGVKATARSNTSVYISWKKASRAKKYQVYRATSKKGKYTQIATTTRPNYLNSKLKKGKKYFYKVRAINGSKKGAFSAIKSVATKKSGNCDVTVNGAERSVTISARVNGKYFTEPTRHLMVDNYGFNKGKSILTSYCTPDDLYNGLVKAGGVSWSKSEGKKLKNGEKNTVGNAENKNFSKLEVTISWNDESGNMVTRSLRDCLTTVKDGEEAPEVEMAFTGNPKAASRTPSGCMVCMDSCYIGMVANTAYGLCVIDEHDPDLYARPDALPADGTVVKVTFRIK